MPHNKYSSQEPNDPPADTPRLQSHLEHMGVSSRRQAARMIRSGVVAVNGLVVTQPGFRLNYPETDVITVNGQKLPSPSERPANRTIMFYKPKGLICSSDDSQGETIYKCLDGLNERLVPIGRLDKDSEGLLLLSNDGSLVNSLTHPKFGHAKEYEVITRGYFDQKIYDVLRSPMKMDGYRIQPVEVEYLERLRDCSYGPRHLLLFILREGRNRQIRNMCELVGLRIESLVRTAINGLRLPDDMRPCEWRDLTPADWEGLTGNSMRGEK